MKNALIGFLCTASLCVVSYAQTSIDAKQKTDNSQSKQQQLVPETPDVIEANRLSIEVVKLYKAKKYNEALPLAERAVRLRETALGEDHYLVASSLYNMTMVQVEREKFSEAKKLAHRSLDIYEKNYGTEDAKLIPVMNIIALLNQKESNYGMAEDHFKKILAIRQKSIGAESSETAEALLNLARLYHSNGSNDKAEKFYQQGLAMQEKTLAQNDKRIAATLRDYSALLFLLNRADEATKLEDRSITINIGGQPNPSLAPIQGGVLNGKAILKFAPAYPIEAKQNRAQGSVIVSVLINEIGRVINARAVTGPPTLRAASENAALQWRFSPTRLSGVPVKVSGTITFNFKLE